MFENSLSVGFWKVCFPQQLTVDGLLTLSPWSLLLLTCGPSGIMKFQADPAFNRIPLVLDIMKVACFNSLFQWWCNFGIAIPLKLMDFIDIVAQVLTIMNSVKRPLVCLKILVIFGYLCEPSLLCFTFILTSIDHLFCTKLGQIGNRKELYWVYLTML